MRKKSIGSSQKAIVCIFKKILTNIKSIYAQIKTPSACVIKQSTSQ